MSDKDQDARNDGAAGVEGGKKPDQGPENYSQGCGGKFRPLPAMDFGSFIISLASTALINLGFQKAPGSEEQLVDLPAAKQMIDIIGMLAQKTAKNLSREEAELLSSVLFDLKMKFVEVCKSPAAKDAK